MNRNYVEVVPNKERRASCICCPSTEEIPDLWDVRFVFGNYTSVIKMCEKHLRELRNQIDKIF
jgi:hypothetical protein